MAKGNTSSGKGKAAVRMKATSKSSSKQPAPKKPAPKKKPTNNKGSRKRPATEESSEDSSEEESDHRPKKKKRAKVSEDVSDEEEGEPVNNNQPEETLHDEAVGGHDSPNESEVGRNLQFSSIHIINGYTGRRAPRSPPYIQPRHGPNTEGPGKRPSTDLHR